MTIHGTGRWVKVGDAEEDGGPGKRRRRKLEREEEGEERTWG